MLVVCLLGLLILGFGWLVWGVIVVFATVCGLGLVLDGFGLSGLGFSGSGLLVVAWAGCLLIDRFCVQDALVVTCLICICVLC